jgi:hypothetical protein
MMTTKPNTHTTSNLATAKNLITEAEYLVRIIDIAAARDDTFEAVTIRDVARQAWEKMIAACELLNKAEAEGEAS